LNKFCKHTANTDHGNVPVLELALKLDLLRIGGSWVIRLGVDVVGSLLFLEFLVLEFWTWTGRHDGRRCETREENEGLQHTFEVFIMGCGEPSNWHMGYLMNLWLWIRRSS
jgi:hypothetical protein